MTPNDEATGMNEAQRNECPVERFVMWLKCVLALLLGHTTSYCMHDLAAWALGKGAWPGYGSDNNCKQDCLEYGSCNCGRYVSETHND